MVLLVAILYLGQLLLRAAATAVQVLQALAIMEALVVLVVVPAVIIKARLEEVTAAQVTHHPSRQPRDILVAAQRLIAFTMHLAAVALEQLERMAPQLQRAQGA
jgi:hypothetical protein